MAQDLSDLFVDIIFGSPLQIFIHQHVEDRSELVELVKKHGGTVVSGYSAIPYILVDPRKQSGQNLFHQYSSKKGKIVLDARWIRECIKAGQLQTFAHNWGGCKVDGTEPQSQDSTSSEQQQQQPTIHAPHPQHFAFQVQVQAAAAQQWQPAPPEQPQITATNGIQSTGQYEDQRNWASYPQPNGATSSYDYARYRQDASGWPADGSFYGHTFAASYQPTFIEEENSGPEAGPSTPPTDKTRGRKRARTVATPAPPASSLVANSRLPARSPSPPTRVVKSTYGGNLFTSDDVVYLKKYIKYCHESGLVLSLREICERIAVKAPHHTFYSWRRYCNKHQIRLGGYQMNADSPDTAAEQETPVVVEPPPSVRLPGGSIHALGAVDVSPSRDRSPTPPRALFRSTTGKGVAFTDEDITGPDAPVPVAQPPGKKLRYGRSDDIILAKYFLNEIQGTSDKIFQAFAQIFYRDGYLVLRGFVSQEDVGAMLARSKELLNEFNIEDHPLTRFTTGDEDHVGDDYFLNSGDKIRYFLEADAVVDHKLTRPKELAVNKIGHALHELDPIFRKVTLENERMRTVVRDLGFHKDPLALQSMVITKQPRIGGEVGEHNDSTFLYTNPPSALGFWIALEQCTATNGALSFLPGSHSTPITKRFVRLPGGGTGFEPLVDQEVADRVSAELQASQSRYILETCQPGDLVLIHGSVLHKSEHNFSEKTRFAYTFHMIEASAGYDSKNWLQPTDAMPFSRILT
ncbi:Phytanoyl-CoA dioxygenase [Mycena indigotica]|uniref:Phytanoyl-CoA dioxygenase n=1 Tax=Mycena indigotica TaxID=2126181 RepID=A0A8H6WF28_9AGAR|nr:Phytanoyl-CoA dioxygenase [Mycena indigotica]KAF7315407.1 Phytanoyl-CoA dioxygenase [Mycena indigotica]